METDKLEIKARIRPGAKALIVDNDKLLMIRERVRGEIIYDFPGGGMDYGEKAEETLHREVFEEVGLRIEVEKILGTWSFILELEPIQILCIAYQCKCLNKKEINLDGNPATEEDIFDYQWIEIAEILKNPKQYLREKGMLKSIEALN